MNQSGLLLKLIIVSLSLGVQSFEDDNFTTETSCGCGEEQDSGGRMGVFKEAAVVTVSQICAPIARDILKRGGNAVDAMIVATLCDGVVYPQNVGLGGGFVMLYYKKSENRIYAVNAREMAPGAASADMFHGNRTITKTGGLAMAIPGELKGLWEIYKRFGGGIEWSELFGDTIDLCREGIPVTQNLAMRAKEKAPDFEKYALLKEMLTDPDTEELVEEGGIMLRPKLADTLEVIRQEGGDALYTGSLSKSFVEDLRDAGSIITEEDMARYTVKIEEVSVPVPLKDGMNLYSSPLPASGPTVEYILSLLNRILPGEDLAADFVRIVEAFKFGFGQRTKCGDPDFVDVERVLDLMRDPEHIQQVQERISNLATSQDPFYYGANFSAAAAHGTGNRVILAPNGDAVVLSSTINLYFGSFVVSPSTGILLNDEMDDFSLPSVNTSQTQTHPPSPANFIRPHKRPLSSMCPVIVLDENRDVRLAVGSAGSEKIITSVVLIAIMNLWYNKTLEEAVNYPRVHHQLYPMSATYEDSLSKDIVDALKSAGHKLQRLTDKLNYGSAATAVAKIDGEIIAIDDFRRPGGFAGY